MESEKLLDILNKFLTEEDIYFQFWENVHNIDKTWEDIYNGIGKKSYSGIDIISIAFPWTKAKYPDALSAYDKGQYWNKISKKWNYYYFYRKHKKSKNSVISKL